MLKFAMEPALIEGNIPFGYVIVQYPQPDQLHTSDFRQLVKSELSALREHYSEYDRKAVFGENPYVRFFKKFKKTYPVMLQFESVMFKGRPFPEYNPVAEVPFLMEIATHVLSGAHDVDQIQGMVELFLGTQKEEFPGMRGVPVHTYPGDFCGRDQDGIIFSLIAGADARTCVRRDSRHVLYPVFGTPGLSGDVIKNATELLVSYIQVLSPNAQIETGIMNC